MRATSGWSGHSAWPSLAVRTSVPAPNSGDSSRGHHSLTPKTAQPACISQKSNGGLWW